MREKLIDVFMHLDRHIQNRDEYGICYTSDFAEAVETVVAMLKKQDANGVTFREDAHWATEQAYKNGYEAGYADGEIDFAPKWIPVTVRLPEEDEVVLCCRGNHIGVLMDVYTYKGDNKWEDSYGYWNYGDIEGITHWMPLPEPPKGE